MLEQCQGSSGGTGTSMNYYHPHAEKWRQLRVSPGVQTDINGAHGSRGSMFECSSRPTRRRVTVSQRGVDNRRGFCFHPAREGDQAAADLVRKSPLAKADQDT